MGWGWALGALERLGGLTAGEVLSVLRPGSRLVPAYNSRLGLWALTVWGQAQSGKYVVAACIRGERAWDWDVVEAREMTAAERAEYKQWEATR
jgi:hypothetical protein